MKRLSLSLICVALFCLGCNAKHCIKIDADLGDGKKGSVDYCLDLSGSEKEGRLILNSNDDKVWGIKEDELKKLLDKTGVGDISIKTMEKIPLGVRLKEVLK